MHNHRQNPYDDFQGNIGKSSGKKQAFMIFVDEVGRAKFRREQGRAPFMRDQADTAILGSYYLALSPEEKQMYKDKERNTVLNTQPEYLRRREADNVRRRRNMHANAELALEATEKHKAKIEEKQNAKVQAEGPLFLEKRRTIFDPNLLVDRDFKTKRLADRHKLYDSLKFSLIAGSQDLVLDQQYCFIGATPSCSQIVDNNREYDLVTVPFELSVVRFSLRQGITARHSYHMNIDPAVVLQDVTSLEEIYKHREQSVSAARRFGFDPLYSDEGAMEEAWYFMKDKCVDAKLVCDTENYNFIAMSLRLLANRVGTAEGYYAQKTFDSNIYCVEDVAMVLKDVAGRKIEDSVVETFFQRNMTSIEAFCTIHGRMLLDNPRRHFCQEARGALNVQRLIDFLRSECLYDMDKIFDPVKHILCQELVGGSKFPRMPRHPLVSSDDVGTQRLDRLMFSDASEDEEEYIDPITRRNVVRSLRGQDTPGFRQQNATPGPSSNIHRFDVPGPSTSSPRNWREAVSTDTEVEEPPPPQLGSTARRPSPSAKSKEPEVIKKVDQFHFSWSIFKEDVFSDMEPFTGTSPYFAVLSA